MSEGFVGFCIGLLFGGMILGGIIMSHGAPFRLIVQHQCGHYDSKSGDFKWNTTIPNEEDK